MTAEGRRRSPPRKAVFEFGVHTPPNMMNHDGGVDMPNGSYQYSFVISASGVVTGANPGGLDGPFEFSETMDLYAEVPLFVNGTEYPYYGIYAGTGAGNSVYIDLSGSYVYFTNDPLRTGDTVAPPSLAAAEPYAACFLTGTAIATPGGEVSVEILAPGDLVLTADGRAVPVKWVGRQSVATTFDRTPGRAPICIEAGALSALYGGTFLPARDLRLTADHALMLAGALVQAGALVNGTTIRPMDRAETGERYVVWHIETQDHEVILAEGCAAETFVDNVTRRRFDNFAEYAAVFGEEAGVIAEIDLPRVKSARQLPGRLRDLIAVRRAA